MAPAAGKENEEEIAAAQTKTHFAFFSFGSLDFIAMLQQASNSNETPYACSLRRMDQRHATNKLEVVRDIFFCKNWFSFLLKIIAISNLNELAILKRGKMQLVRCTTVISCGPLSCSDDYFQIGMIDPSQDLLQKRAQEHHSE